MSDDKAVVDRPDDSDGYRDRLGSEVAIGIDDISALPKGTVDPVYEAKARVLNRAIQDIGMGWYVSWHAFHICLPQPCTKRRD